MIWVQLLESCTEQAFFTSDVSFCPVSSLTCGSSRKLWRCLSCLTVTLYPSIYVNLHVMSYQSVCRCCVYQCVLVGLHRLLQGAQRYFYSQQTAVMMGIPEQQKQGILFIKKCYNLFECGDYHNSTWLRFRVEIYILLLAIILNRPFSTIISSPRLCCSKLDFFAPLCRQRPDRIITKGIFIYSNFSNFGTIPIKIFILFSIQNQN